MKNNPKNDNIHSMVFGLVPFADNSGQNKKI